MFSSPYYPWCRWRGPPSLFRAPCRSVRSPLLSTFRTSFFVHPLLFLARACACLLISEACFLFSSPTWSSNILLHGNEAVGGGVPRQLRRLQTTVSVRVGGPRGAWTVAGHALCLSVLGSRRKALMLNFHVIPESCWCASSFPSGILLVRRFYCAA